MDLRQPVDIKDHGHATIAENSGSGQTLDFAKIGIQAFHHGLHLSEQLIDEQGVFFPLILDKHDQTQARIADAPRPSQELVKAQEGNDFAADRDDLATPA
jgi:hypothetical protein